MRKIPGILLAFGIISALPSTAMAEGQSFLFRWGTAGVQSFGTTSVDCTTPSGATVLDGDTVTAYQADNVPFGNTCTSEVQTCTGGTLSGTFTFASCSVNPAANCTTPWSAPVAHGADIPAFQTASVPFGNTCNSEQRDCFNGTLSGSFTNQSCAPLAAANCTTPWGATVAHGSGVTAFQTASVPHGNTCVSETRSCTNGTLSGSYAVQSCTPDPAPPVACNMINDQQVNSPATRIVSTTAPMTKAQCGAWCVSQGAQAGYVCWANGNGSYDANVGCGLYTSSGTHYQGPGFPPGITNMAAVCN